MGEDSFKDKFEKYIYSNILIDNKLSAKHSIEDTVESRIDILERFIELFRFHRLRQKNNISLNKVLDFDIDFLENGKIRIIDYKPSRDLKYCLKPEDLQFPLLSFLLVYDKANDIYSTIEDFVVEIKPILKPLDFEKGKTGAARCFTNTRFAANTLRCYGLLKFTNEERFRRWKLSYLGIIVASLMYRKDWLNYLKRTDYQPHVSWHANLPRTIDAALDMMFDKQLFARHIHDSIIECKIDASDISYSLNELTKIISKYRAILETEYKQLVKNKLAIKVIEEMEDNKAIIKLMNSFKIAYEMKDFNRKIYEFIKGGPYNPRSLASSRVRPLRGAIRLRNQCVGDKVLRRMSPPKQ